MLSIDLELPDHICARLKRYISSSLYSAAQIRTDHWATYGAKNRIVFCSNQSRIRLTGGVGFDDCYALNFNTTGPLNWLTQKWIFWRKRQTKKSFIRAFQATAVAGELDLNQVGTVLGEAITPHKPLAAYYYNFILRHSPWLNDFQYLEIGAGTGYLAATFHHARKCRVIVVDLPEIIPFSFIYLSQRFPEATFQLPSEVDVSSDISGTADFVFLCPDQIALIPSRSVDLAVNTASFGEMMPHQVSVYFELLRRVSKQSGLLFTANRVAKRMRPNQLAGSDHLADDGVDVIFEEYPWVTADTDVSYGVSPFHEMVQPQSPFLMRLVRLSP